MRALSIRQPWAALIVMGLKDIENRPWRTSHRGSIFVHASLGRSGRSLYDIERIYGVALSDELMRLCALVGGIIGSVDLVDCVSASASPWFDGPRNEKGRRNYGLMLRNARELPFCPTPGRLSLFEVSGAATQIATGLPLTGWYEAGAHVGERAETANEMGLIKIGVE
jgi:hypothetical protein